MNIFHTTTPAAANAITSEGFRDRTGSYGFNTELTGVWVSNQPLGPNEGPRGEVLLEIDLVATDERIDCYEVKEQDKPYREWLLPADFLNAHGTIVRRYETPVEWPD